MNIYPYLQGGDLLWLFHDNEMEQVSTWLVSMNVTVPVWTSLTRLPTGQLRWQAPQATASSFGVSTWTSPLEVSASSTNDCVSFLSAESGGKGVELHACNKNMAFVCKGRPHTNSTSEISTNDTTEMRQPSVTFTRGSSSYVLFEQAWTFTQASKNCKAQGATLASWIGEVSDLWLSRYYYCEK